ncbi:MAG: hypothetical protein IJC82_03430 [Firmicutes bacterium]|nr:hypothetical protein [Bacillota bacterium]
MKGSVKTVFPGNNSVEGFYSFYRSGLEGMERICILKGGPGTGKSSLMRHIAEYFSDHGVDVELWQCSSDNDSLDGVLIPAYKTALIDGTPPHGMDPAYPGVREEIWDLGAFWNEDLLKKKGNEIIALTDRISATFASAYEKLKEAGEWDQKILSLREKDRDFKGAKGFAESIFGVSRGCLRHLFAAAVTPQGVVDHTFDLCAGIDHRYFLCGKRGLGQQVYMDTLVDTAVKREIPVDIYHGHLDPGEIVLLIFPTLQTSVAAVESLPSSAVQEGDRIVSFHSNVSTEEEKKAERSRDHAVSAAVSDIMAAHKLHDALESYYISAMDFKKIDILKNNFLEKFSKIDSKDM